MTNQQIKDQLSRLKIFGNLGDSTQLEAYLIALRHLDYTQYVRAIEQLISTYDKRSFPLPADILRNVREIVTNTSYSFDKTGDSQITSAFMGAFSVIFNLENKDDFRRLNNELLEINNRFGDAIGEAKNEEIRLLNELKNEALMVTKYKGDEFIRTKQTIRQETLQQETIENLPF